MSQQPRTHAELHEASKLDLPAYRQALAFFALNASDETLSQIKQDMHWIAVLVED